jgi:site-specific recombinase XerD
MKKQGSIHYQIQELFLRSGIFVAGASKHEAKIAARQRGIVSSKGLGEQYMIYSYGTAKSYFAVWHQLGNYVRLVFNLKSLPEITPDHIRGYLRHRMAKGVARSTFSVDVAALKKLHKALLLLHHGHTNDFRGVADEMMRQARAVLRQDHRPRAYQDPSALFDAIGHGRCRLAAKVQFEGGARVFEASLIKEMQLRGNTADPITGELRGKIHLVHTKGGLERDILLSLGTYQEIVDVIERAGVFRVNREVYRRRLVKAAEQTRQSYQGTHGLRWLFAQRRFVTCRDHGMCKDEALRTVSHEMGHRRASITLRYLHATPW